MKQMKVLELRNMLSMLLIFLYTKKRNNLFRLTKPGIKTAKLPSKRLSNGLLSYHKHL